MLPALLLALAPLSGPAAEGACRWLDAKSAAEVLLVTPTEVTGRKDAVVASQDGMVASSTCIFKDKAEPAAQLAVSVMEYGSESQAKAAYERELKRQGARARPSKVDGHPGFFTQNPGFSAGSFVAKGRFIIFISHAFSRRVNEAIARDPDGGPLSTHEIARRVLARL